MKLSTLAVIAAFALVAIPAIPTAFSALSPSSTVSAGTPDRSYEVAFHGVHIIGGKNISRTYSGTSRERVPRNRYPVKKFR